MCSTPMNDDLPLIVDLNLGLDAEQFLNTPLGRYLLDRADEEKEEALADFRKADPGNYAVISDIQNRIWRSEAFSRWLAEAIHIGRHAENELKNLE